MTDLVFNTKEITALTNEIYRVRLAPEEGEVFEFKAGQYLFLKMPDGKNIPLSIASAPEQKSYIELHIRVTHPESLAADMIELFRTGSNFEIDAPFGECVLEKGDSPVVIIAGGTGFSSMKSLLESAFVQFPKREFALYLGAQKAEELYQTSIIENWQTDAVKFSYIPVVGETTNSWDGATGFPHEVAIKDYQDKATQCEFFVSGSEPMVMNVYQALKEAGVTSERIHSDILDIKRASGQL